MGKIALLMLTVAPLLVLLVTYGDKSRTAYLARAMAMGALCLFWLSLGTLLFIVDGLQPVFSKVSKETSVIVWLLVFAAALWAVVWNVKKSCKTAGKKMMDFIKVPEEPSSSTPTPQAPALPPKDMQQADSRLKTILGE